MLIKFWVTVSRARCSIFCFWIMPMFTSGTSIIWCILCLTVRQEQTKEKPVAYTHADLTQVIQGIQVDATLLISAIIVSKQSIIAILLFKIQSHSQWLKPTFLLVYMLDQDKATWLTQFQVKAAITSLGSVLSSTRKTIDNQWLCNRSQSSTEFLKYEQHTYNDCLIYTIPDSSCSHPWAMQS